MDEYLQVLKDWKSELQFNQQSLNDKNEKRSINSVLLLLKRFLYFIDDFKLSKQKQIKKQKQIQKQKKYELWCFCGYQYFYNLFRLIGKLKKNHFFENYVLLVKEAEFTTKRSPEIVFNNIQFFVRNQGKYPINITFHFFENKQNKLSNFQQVYKQVIQKIKSSQ